MNTDSAAAPAGIDHDFVVGVDIGTQSTKAVLVAADGRIVGPCARSYRLDTPKPLWAEQWPPGGGLLFLPYLIGERSPVWEAQASGLLRRPGAPPRPPGPLSRTEAGHAPAPADRLIG